MKELSKNLGFFLAAYLIAWTLVYALIMGGNFQYFGVYFRLAWTSPGEIPTLIQVAALGCAIVAVLVVWRYRAKRRNSNRPA
jgi:membrane protein implicated in regulation of membrane protease activity